MRFLFLAPFFLVIGCTSTESKPTEKDAVLPLIAYVDSFKKAHPDMLNNDILKAKADTAFKYAILTQYKRGILNGLPYKFERVKEYKPGGYAAHFSYWVGDLHLDGIALVDSSIVSSLKENDTYILSGQYKANLDESLYPVFTSNAVWNDQIKIADEQGASLGVVLLDSVTIKKQ